MDFNSILFLGFLAGTAVLNYALPRVLRPFFLLIASYAFYMYKPENAALVALLLGATVTTWAAGLAIGNLKNRFLRRFFLLLAIATCCGFLFFYKYFGFFDQMLVDVSALLGRGLSPIRLELAAPLGLSYFTFASLGYTIDVYRGQYPPEKNPLYYALFVSFFPCIFTGPIERYPHLMPQLRQPRRFDYDRCAGGVFRMLWGYFKKLVLADNIALFVSAVYTAPGTFSGPLLLLASLLFSMQIYLDFSGCCDIAIGGAKLLGYDLLENFDSPFLATSFSQLWTRWHMSLTGWFRDYIYIPLGGSRRGRLRHYANLLLVFLVSGLWHGAAWGYVIWGLLGGVFSVLEKLTQPLRDALWRALPGGAQSGPARWSKRLCTYLLFTCGIVFFACALYGADWSAIYGGLGRGWAAFLAQPVQALQPLADVGLSGGKLVTLICGVAVVLAVESQGKVCLWIRQQSWSLRWPLYYMLAAAILFFAAFGQSAFIYQQY